MFNNQGYSLSDIAAATGSNNDGIFGNNNGAWWIIILFLFAFVGGYGNNGGLFGNAGRAQNISDGYVLASDFANIERKIDGVNNGLCDGFYTNAQLTNGVNGNISAATQNILTQMSNNTMAGMKDTFDLQTAITNANNNITAQLTALGAQTQQCCCDAKYQSATQAADLNYRLAEQGCQTRQAVANATSAITMNQDANTRSILDTLREMQTQNLQDKINSLTADNQALRFAASQQMQNAYLVNALNPPPIPAYTVPNPYTGTYGMKACQCY